jgi:carbonic anhydrase
MIKKLSLILAAFTLHACTSAPPKENKVETPELGLQTAPQVLPNSSSLNSPSGPIEKEGHLKKAQEQAQNETEQMKSAVKKAVAKLESSGEKSHREIGPVPSEKALSWLKNGNLRFEKGYFRADGVSSKDRSRLTSGQKPHSIILSCSDSRVPPEVVFDQKLGEVFVVRTAGQAINDNVVASIEYAIEHLGTNLLVVMGHESCGAVKATLQSLTGADLGTPALNALAADIRPRVQSFANKPLSEGLLQESWSNVHGVEKDLLERSALIRDVVNSGEVKLVKAMYHLDSGKVEWQ